MIDLQPTICNLCNGDVEYISNASIYGRTYGSGYCYRCRNCRAYVGTHERRPKIAFGILANEEMRKWKMKCHGVFDNLWQSRNESERQRYRKKYYEKLAEKLNIQPESCHFGYFDLTTLKQAYEILISGKIK
jgi:hypothetical protein